MFYTVAEPYEFLTGNLIMLRISGLHIGAFEEFEAAAVVFGFAGPDVDKARLMTFGQGARAFDVVGGRGVVRQHEQQAVIGALGCLMQHEGCVIQITIVHAKLCCAARIFDARKPPLVMLLRDPLRFLGAQRLRLGEGLRALHLMQRDARALLGDRQMVEV